MENFIYSLKQPLNYYKGGEKLESYQLEITSPSMKTYKYSSKISQMMMSALMDAEKFADRDVKKKEEDIDKNIPPDALKMMVMTSNCDLELLRDRFIKYCTHNCYVSMEEGIIIKEEAFDSLSVEDFENLLFGFCSFFIMPSLLNMA